MYENAFKGSFIRFSVFLLVAEPNLEKLAVEEATQEAIL